MPANFTETGQPLIERRDARNELKPRSRARSTRRAADLESWIATSSELSTFDPVAWDKLSESALAANPFYASTFVKAGLGTIDATAGVFAFMLRNREGQLVGLFPFRKSFGKACGAHNIYQFNGAPLVHREYVENVIGAWIAAIAAGDLPQCWQFRDIQLGGELYDAIDKAAVQHGFSLVAVNTYQRPQLTKLEGGLQEHLNTVLSKSRRKELERCRRRLNEQGSLRLERADSPETVASALEAYLSLENAGWKGKSGTAFLAHGHDGQFARAAFRNGGPMKNAVIDTLLLNDKPIAISINLVSGSTLFTPKCTFDETLRSFAPGLLLEYLIIEQFYRDPNVARMDAATTVDGHVVQGLWNETVPMGTLFVGRPRLATRAAWIASAHSQAKASAKRILSGVRKLKHSGLHGLRSTKPTNH